MDSSAYRTNVENVWLCVEAEALRQCFIEALDAQTMGGFPRADTRSSTWSPSCTLVSPLPLHTCTADQWHTLKMYSFVMSWQNKGARWHTNTTAWSLSASLSYAPNALVWGCGSAALRICEWGLILSAGAIHAITSAAKPERHSGPCFSSWSSEV